MYEINQSMRCAYRQLVIKMEKVTDKNMIEQIKTSIAKDVDLQSLVDTVNRDIYKQVMSQLDNPNYEKIGKDRIDECKQIVEEMKQDTEKEYQEALASSHFIKTLEDMNDATMNKNIFLIGNKK
jgi:hypothetical protein